MGSLKFFGILGLFTVNLSLNSAKEAEEASLLLINVADLLDVSVSSSSIDTSVTSNNDVQDVVVARYTNLVTNVVVTLYEQRSCDVHIKT